MYFIKFIMACYVHCLLSDCLSLPRTLSAAQVVPNADKSQPNPTDRKESSCLKLIINLMVIKFIFLISP